MDSYRNKVIMHLDGDAFFASVEQVKNWKLKGKPIVTGGERFIAASMSYEAKAKGVTRGMMVADIKKVCPDVVIVPSDYKTYAIFARRMFNIVRKYTPIVEEYSIDECFADITGLDKEFGMSYEEIGKIIKDELERKLGLTFGVGLAPTKVLAKVASKHRKPAGYTIIKNNLNDIESFLSNLPIEKVWGIGTSTTKHLRSNNILTALDFAKLTSAQLSSLNIAKPHREIHAELKGLSVMTVNSEGHGMPKSIMSSRTFVPASRKEDIVFSHLSKNLEEACERLRFVGAKASAFTIFLKTQEFRYFNTEFNFGEPTDDLLEIMKTVRIYFKEIFKTHVDYRATGITLRGLVDKNFVESKLSLFDSFEFENLNSDEYDRSNIRHKSRLNKENIDIDKINRKYGEHTIMLGSSLKAVKHFQDRKKVTHIDKKVWAIPFLGIAS